MKESCQCPLQPGANRAREDSIRTKEDIVKIIILIIAMVLAFSTAVRADCKLDATTATRCSDQYQSGAEICKAIHHDPLDSGDLSICMTELQDEYNKCTAGCY